MHTIFKYFTDQREYYKVEINVSPPQESHEIGSRVTFNCTATPSSQIYQNFTFPLSYRWYFPDRGSSYSSSTNTFTIGSYEQSSGNVYCLINRGSSNPLLGQGRLTFNVKGNYK